ncbi:MAG: [Fe-Fe] hydrogenase large subunit C-terminal domain-containing protein [Bacillota bacterium]|jgi:iron only hydrogenase large subunit-like protein/anti-sigma regulatory factor (Ser/Thr protein kinase)
MAVPPERRLLCAFDLNRNDFRKIGDEFYRLKRALLEIGFPSDASRRASVAAYELAMNIVIHADRGSLSVYWDDGTLQIEARDEGPGIPDVDLAMTDGYSTAPDYVREMGYGAGMGLPNIKRSVDSFELLSTPGVGTEAFCRVRPGEPDSRPTMYFHSVTLDTSKCKGCTNCIKSCPTEAIRVISGKAFILEDRCIDCGECIRRCPNKAKSAVSDSWDSLSLYDYTIALVAPSFYGQFGDLTQTQVRNALVAPGGFNEVFDVSIAADLVSMAMREYIRDHDRGTPLISSACPAVLRLIQVRNPSLLKNVIPCEAPMEVAAWMAKRRAIQSDKSRNPTAIFISPCPAKITATKQPVGRARSLVDGNVSASLAYAWVRQRVKAGEKDEETPVSTGLGMGWGRSGGEMGALGSEFRSLAVDGIAQVASVLDEVEKGILDGQVDFIEAQACLGGCVGGCLNIENPFVARMRLRDLAVRYKDAPPNPATHGIGHDEPHLWYSLCLSPRAVFSLHEDPKKAEEKLLRLEEIEAGLPNLDCGACGAPTCRALAEDIVQGRGALSDCTFKLRERLEALADEVKSLATIRPPVMAQRGDSEMQKGSV